MQYSSKGVTGNILVPADHGLEREGEVALQGLRYLCAYVDCHSITGVAECSHQLLRKGWARILGVYQVRPLCNLEQS
jgi:hypothetical protein